MPLPRPAPGRRLLLLLTAVLGFTVPSALAAVPPLEFSQAIGDPSVVKTKKQQYVAIATGPQVIRMVSKNGRRWHATAPALAARPSWARPKGEIWAADLVRLGRTWVLYYSAPVYGMTSTSRCIGVATARISTGQFRPVGDRPLVCPPAAKAPPAWDPVLEPGMTTPTYPTIGAIDPSIFLDRGRVFLLYKTDGKPSSIRILRLKRGGLQPFGPRSRALFGSAGVLENPVMVRRGKWVYAFMSAGDYTRCSYATVWRRSKNIWDWSRRVQRVLLDSTTTRGVCGPGGADVLVDGRDVKLYFHGWTCNGSPRPCLEPFHNWDGKEAYRTPVRALYGAHLTFTKRHVVKVDRFIRPRRG